MTSTEAVTAATDPTDFDLTNFIKAGAVSLPKETVECLTDLEAGYRIAFEVLPQIDAYEKQFGGTVGGVPEDDEYLMGLRAEETKLRERIQNTRITFELRGVAPAYLKVITKLSKRESKAASLDTEDATEYHTIEVLRAATQKITWHEHNRVVETKLTHEQMQDLFDSLPQDQQGKLFQALDLLCYGVVLTSEVIDAGFPRGAVDEA